MFLYPSLGESFSMKRYLQGVKGGFKANSITYEVVQPSGQGLKAKYLDYPLLAWYKRNQTGKHLIISERYTYLLPFIGSDSIVVCHDLHTLYIESKTAIIHRFVYRLLLNLMRKAKKVVCVSQHTKFDLLQHSPRFKSHPRVEVVHNGIENFWIGSETVEIEALEIKRLFKEKNILLSLGTDAWYKNNQWSLRLLAELDARYHILRVGIFNPANQQLIQDLDLVDRITSVQSINDQVLKFCYQNVKALLFPSLTEGYGWPALEAALCGCQVVSDGNGATKEIFKDCMGLIPLGKAGEYLNRKPAAQPQLNYTLWKEQVTQLIA